MKNSRVIKFILLIIFYGNFFLLFGHSNASQDVKIIVKVDNLIITSEDINYESNYLMALNENLNKLKKQEVYEIAKVSLIKEKIKKNEIKKYVDIKSLNNNKLIDDIIQGIYKRLGFNNISDFEIYLNTFELSSNEIKKKLNIEMLWNQLIAAKYKNRVNID